MSTPILLSLNKVEPQSSAWLWPNRIPLGAITTLIGYGGEGKSFLACSVASTVSRGGTFCDGSQAPQGAVVMMAGEDLPAKLRARYEANGADLERITLLQGQRIYTKTGPAEISVTLRDIDTIREAIDQTPSVKLLIIDPIGDFIPGVNSDKDNEVRSLLNPLTHLAQERQLAVLMICHRKKGAGDRADSAALGSVAFTAKARAVHHVILDPYDTAHPSERRRFFLPGKLNDQQQSQGLAFKIIAPQGIIQWDEAPITHSADAIMQYAAAKARAERTSDPAALTETESWLNEALKQGPRPVTQLFTQARAEGISPKMLRTAKTRLGITHSRISAQGVYVWRTPSALTTSTSADAPTNSESEVVSQVVSLEGKPRETSTERGKAGKPGKPPTNSSTQPIPQRRLTWAEKVLLGQLPKPQR